MLLNKQMKNYQIKTLIMDIDKIIMINSIFMKKLKITSFKMMINYKKIKILKNIDQKKMKSKKITYKKILNSI